MKTVVLALFLLSVILCAVSEEKKPCPVICTLDYRPLCASDGAETRTFSNPCALESENCHQRKSFRQVSQGECPKEA